MELKCPSCNKKRERRKYLCADCWWLLKPWVRRDLEKKDNMATARVIILRRKISLGVPLEDLELNP